MAENLTNNGLLLNCEKLLNAKTVYMWGCYGQALTHDLINRKKEQYPNRFSAARRDYLAILADEGGWYACDCAGLIKNYFWGGFGNKIRYSSSSDYGTEGMKKASKVSGKILNLPDIPGVIVYKKGHIGVYIGDGEVIECTLGSRGDGVVKTKLSYAGWTDWFYSPVIVYGEPAAVKKTVKKKNRVIDLFKKLITRKDKLL